MLIDYLKAIYYELKAGFVLEKINYRIEGKCNKCGSCCRYMYAVDTYTKREFEFMTRLFPKYKRFEIVGTDKDDRLVFGCKLVGEDNLCTDYKNRLSMCKKYPHGMVNYGGKLPESCGFRVVIEKDFKDYLK